MAAVRARGTLRGSGGPIPSDRTPPRAWDPSTRCRIETWANSRVSGSRFCRQNQVGAGMTQATPSLGRGPGRERIDGPHWHLSRIVSNRAVWCLSTDPPGSRQLCVGVCPRCPLCLLGAALRAPAVQPLGGACTLPGWPDGQARLGYREPICSRVASRSWSDVME